MQPINIIFFGSTTDSVIVLEKLSNLPAGKAGVVAVVTQPPKPVGRKQLLTPTPVETWAKEHSIPVLSFPSDEKNSSLFSSEETVIDTLQPFKADILVSASYGQKIPMDTIRDATYGGLNVHPSILPRWRGADPVPWAILSGDHQIGVTIVSIAETFDSGRIFAQKKIPILNTDTTDPLRATLFDIGAQLLVDTIPDYLSGKNKGRPQNASDTPYARRLTRDDGFEKWENIFDPTQSEKINRKFRAFHPWPGVWTRLPAGRRLKILSFKEKPILVQLEGKNPVLFSQFQNAYLS